jgi:hypothetical protein
MAAQENRKSEKQMPPLLTGPRPAMRPEVETLEITRDLA